jgi:hypothetical protein
VRDCANPYILKHLSRSCPGRQPHAAGLRKSDPDCPRRQVEFTRAGDVAAIFDSENIAATRTLGDGHRAGLVPERQSARTGTKDRQLRRRQNRNEEEDSDSHLH